ncbi:phage head closure protein [Pseudomonas asturiensis]|uniref:Phage head closure protein n=1 Tax=Pseudomonas asturiensis TaxID=1190415 RepID=A0ABX6HAK4_9PSED|nr:phage head closure protein [Pseudomonas asturiensis]QHF02443.1 phage head closure protein [Pseudomonas asturiensis]
MRAGPLRHVCELQQVTRVREPGGGYAETWEKVRDVRAEITVPTGRTQVVAQQITSVISAEMRCRPAPDLVAQRRLVHGGITYLIEAVLPDNERSMLRLLCSNVPNP